MGFYKNNTIEVTFRGKKYRIAKQDKAEFDALSKKKKAKTKKA